MIALVYSEAERVESWRLHELLEAGYTLAQATLIAHSEVDLHEAVDLLAAGCAPQTAVEILL